MAEFPKIGDTYTSLDNEEYQNNHKMEGVGKILKCFLILCLIVLCLIQVYQINDLQTRVRQMEFKYTIEVDPEFSALENANSKQDSKIRQLFTDVDLLYKIINGQDPFYSEKEEDYE